MCFQTQRHNLKWNKLVVKANYNCLIHKILFFCFLQDHKNLRISKVVISEWHFYSWFSVTLMLSFITWQIFEFHSWILRKALNDSDWLKIACIDLSSLLCLNPGCVYFCIRHIVFTCLGTNMVSLLGRCWRLVQQMFPSHPSAARCFCPAEPPLRSPASIPLRPAENDPCPAWQQMHPRRRTSPARPSAADWITPWRAADAFSLSLF